MSTIVRLCLVVGILVSAPLISNSQTATSPGNATSLITSISNAVWGGSSVKSLQYSGTATWQVGSQVQQASISGTADYQGNSNLQLSGQVIRTETETAIEFGRTCQWGASTTELQTEASFNCLKSVEWLFPPLTLQPGNMPSGVGAVDLGFGEFSVGTLRHLQAQAVLSAIPTSFLTASVQSSTADLGVDPTTFLPAVLDYEVAPDSGGPLSIDIEIRYSNYQKIGNAQIPFHIQRFVNGTLQLDIQLTSANLS